MIPPGPWRADVYKGSKPWSKDIPEEQGEWSISCQHPDYPEDPKYRLTLAVTGFGVVAMEVAKKIVEIYNENLEEQ